MGSTKTTYTPGPWEASTEIRGQSIAVTTVAKKAVRWIDPFSSAEGTKMEATGIARVRAFHAEEGKANAHLIAAAPTLLAACNEVLKFAFKHEVQYWLDADGTDAEKLNKIVDIMRDAIAKADGK